MTIESIEDPEPHRRGPYKNGERRRASIIAGAVEAFGRHGYAGTTLRQIADDVGASPAALLAHFGSKENLLAAVLLDLEEETSAGRPESGSGAAYFRWLAALPATQLARPAYIELLLTLATEASNPAHPSHEFMRDRYARLVEVALAHLAEAQAAGEFQNLQPEDRESEVRGLIAILDGLNLQWLLDRSIDLPAIMSRHTEAVFARWSGTDRTEHPSG